MICFSKAYWKKVSDRNRIRGKRAQLRIHEKMLARDADADTVRQRALYDRRGTHYATVTKPSEAGPQTFALQWSIDGRCDQLDVIHAGAIIATIRPSLVLSEIDKIIAQKPIIV